jgi:dihydrodipicolinate reductase
MGSQGNPIKVMVTGASGMLGRSLCRCLAQYPDDFVVVPLGFSRAVPPMRKVDLTDTAALHTLFSEVQPDVLVHTAAVVVQLGVVGVVCLLSFYCTSSLYTSRTKLRLQHLHCGRGGARKLSLHM